MSIVSQMRTNETQRKLNNAEMVGTTTIQTTKTSHNTYSVKFSRQQRRIHFYLYEPYNMKSKIEKKEKKIWRLNWYHEPENLIQYARLFGAKPINA